MIQASLHVANAASCTFDVTSIGRDVIHDVTPLLPASAAAGAKKGCTRVNDKLSCTRLQRLQKLRDTAHKSGQCDGRPTVTFPAAGHGIPHRTRSTRVNKLPKVVT